MMICEKCFNDIEVKSLIVAKGRKGKCSICKRENVYIYDTDEDFELGSKFDDIINIYTPALLFPSYYPKDKKTTLVHELLERWNIFNNLKEHIVYKILLKYVKMHTSILQKYLILILE